MIESLLSLPKQFADVATNIATLLTRLSTARAVYLDKLNVTGNVASAADVAALANLDSPLLKPPIASGITAARAVNYNVTSGGHSAFDIQVTTTSTSYVNVVNYAGSGVLEFCAFCAQEGAGTSSQMEIIIDGQTVYSGSSAATTGAVNTYVPVGGIDTYSVYTFVALGAVPFKTSLQIRHKVTGSGMCATVCKYRKTS